MKISNLPDCSDGSWEPYVTAKTWTLSKLDSQVSVFAEFQDLRGDTTPCISASIIHDDIAPTATFSTAANQITNNAGMVVQWTAADNLSGIDTITCNGPGGTNGACGSQYQAASTVEGNNSVTLVLKDKAGNTSAPFVYSWLFDRTPPTAVINSAPPSLTGSGNAILSFSATDATSGVAALYCSIDGGAAAACTSPANYSVTAGPHTFTLYATDKAGNKSQTVSAAWTVDMTAPTIMFTQTPPPYNNSMQNVFGFTGTKNGQPITIFECSTDGGAFASCTSPTTVTLNEGPHTFAFRGTDSLGNISAPLTYNWVVDLTAPVVTITSGPLALNNSPTANLTWTATDALSGIKMVECKIDANAYAACNLNAMNYANLLAGGHTFSVRATDNAGNQSVATRSWTIDLTPPVVTITSGPNAYTNQVSSNFAFTATDASGIAGYECHVDNNAFAACTSPFTAANLNEGTHIFYVRATDNAGNVSAVANQSWTIDLSPPIIRFVSTPSALMTGDHAVIQYQVVDLSSGVASINCGVTAPSGSLAACPATNTLDLGALAAGNYTFTISATDNVGNSFSDHVNFTVTARPVICDPFSSSSDATCSGGLVGNIYYLNSSQQTTFANSSSKTVDYFIQSGTKVNALLDLNQLFVSTRSFTQGFPTNGGTLITDNTGATLTAYFAFDLTTIMKLDPLNDQPGWYQFATLSDDGSVVLITPSGTTTASTLIGNDGDHSTEMGCGTQAVYFDDTTRLATEIKYYQGPPTEIALVLMWRKVNGPTDALDSHCGLSGNNAFFGNSPYTNFTTSGYGQLLNNGWKVMGSTNFLAPPTNTH